MFSAISLVAAIRYGVFMSLIADLRIVVDTLGVLVPMPDRIACLIDDLGLFTIIIRRESIQS